ncbi:MAG: transporter [Gammaproteobacteria bacterium]|nr:transporter [Gammaproteobacteria bacterium]
MGRLPAQELEPRASSNTQTGVNLLGMGMGDSEENILLDPALPIEGLKGDLRFGVLRYIRTLGFMERSAKVAVMVPFTSGDWRGLQDSEYRERNASGLGDLRMTAQWNFLGAPALGKSDIRRYRQDTIVGANLRVIVPTGDYNSNRAINLGSNRWTTRAELVVSRSWGSWTLEDVGSVWIYGDNDDFFDGQKLAQDERYVLKTHLVYLFRPGFWFGLGLGYGEGGRTSVDGVRRNNRQQNWRQGATLAYPINVWHGLSVTLGSGRNDGAGGDFDTIAVGYQYAWGDI